MLLDAHDESVDFYARFPEYRVQDLNYAVVLGVDPTLPVEHSA